MFVSGRFPRLELLTYMCSRFLAEKLSMNRPGTRCEALLEDFFGVAFENVQSCFRVNDFSTGSIYFDILF